ncbi:Bud-site selection protein [Dactylonectria estremocensis]|uniref:Bud-site selection protein n=1 Tax=Dactylonectria estremocensis TaxID=1079267 RepID=A0A9P9FAG4_9HYPO|nr:Bud-site selection protein [Dactylonectria estremocensis]
MSKRKRSNEPSLQDRLNKHSDEISRALKAAKGLERQRLSRRVHENGVTPDKKERLEREITVLKSLDLHQTARAHMHGSLLKVKAIAESEDLPEDLRRGLAKPNLSEEERVALHNVTSGLYNRDQVKQAVDKAVAAVCEFLNVPVPKKGKRVRKGKQEKEEQDDQIASKGEEEKGKQKQDQASGVNGEDVVESVEDDEESDFRGFSDGPDVAEELDDEDEADEEEEYDKYDHLLGSSSDEEEDDFAGERFERFRGKETVNLDDISLSGSGADSDSEPDDEESSGSPSPPPAKKKKAKSSSAAAPARPTGSTFLPSLMGGYISGSESASDVDVAPAKKRRGQRQRQAIWEKKFGEKAKHLQNPTKGGRDSGWDMRRGAVEGADSGTPWKKGIRNPLVRQGGGSDGLRAKEVDKPPPKKDDEGVLHPSWEAMKKAKESQKTASFAGSKITFD